MIPKRPRSSSSSARMSSESSEDSRFAVLLAATEKEHAVNAGANGEKGTTTATAAAMSGAPKRRRRSSPSAHMLQHEAADIAGTEANFAVESPGHSHNSDALTEDTATATPTTTEHSSHSCGTVSCSPGRSPNMETVSPFTPYKPMSPSKLVAGAIDEEPMYLRALHALERIRGTQHPEVGKALLHMARFYFQRGRIVEAESCMLGSWDIFKDFVAHYPQHERPVDCLEGYLELMKNMQCTAQLSKVEEEVMLLTPKPSPMERSAYPSVEANA